MTNHALMQAMVDARFNETTLAKAAEVDPKTVSRWLSNEHRFPHPRHRWLVSEALGVDETVLWPETARLLIKVGHEREIASCWPVRAEMPNSDWGRLLRASKREITLAGWTCYFLWLETPNLGALLRQKAEAGCRVRFLIGSQTDPATAEREAIEQTPLTLSVRIAVTLDQLAKLNTVPGIEARYADRRLMGLSVFRFDDQAVVTPHLATSVGTDSPTFLVRKLSNDGLFEQFTTNHVEQLWTDARPVW